MPIDRLNGVVIEIEEKVLTYLVRWNIHGKVSSTLVIGKVSLS